MSEQLCSSFSSFWFHSRVGQMNDMTTFAGRKKKRLVTGRAGQRWADRNVSYLECALTLDSDKETSLLAILVLGINGEIGATHHTDLDLTIDNQG